MLSAPVPDTLIRPVPLPANDGELHPRPVDIRVARAAQAVSVPTEQVERLPFDLSALEAEGVFVNVDARGFGLLDRRLDWQALGITLPEGGAELAFRPPRCGLVPDRYRLPLLRPASRAHTALHTFSYHFTLVETVLETPAYRWIPWRAFPSFERNFDTARAQLQAALEAYAEDYEAVRQTVLETFHQLGLDSARRLAATGQRVPDGFARQLVDQVERLLPTPDDLASGLMLRYRVGVIQLGSEMLAEQRQAAEARRQLEQTQERAQLEQQRRDAASRLVQEQLWAEQERVRQQLRAEAEERQREAAIKERLRQLKVEAARERLQEAMSPLEEGARQLHAAVFEAATAIQVSLQKHQHLPGASAKKARELSRWFRLMNWQSDVELDTLLADLERLASQPKARKPRDPVALTEVLDDIIARTYADARALTEPHRMGALEL